MLILALHTKIMLCEDYMKQMTTKKNTWNIGKNWGNEYMILSVAQHFISKSREKAYLEILFLY